MKLSDAKAFVSKINILKESSLNYQTLYRYTNVKEVFNILSGAWEFNQYAFRTKSFIGDGKYTKKFGKSFTRSIGANGMILWKNSADILLEIDKDALSRISGGKIIFKPYNFHHFYSSKASVKNRARGYADEAEDVAILTTGSWIFKFNPKLANKFIKVIYCDKSKIIDKETLSKLISLCKEYKLNLKFTNIETDSSKDLDVIRDTEQINEANQLKKKVTEKDLWKELEDEEKERMASQIKDDVIRFLPYKNLDEDDQYKVDKLNEKMSYNQALTIVYKTSPYKEKYKKIIQNNINSYASKVRRGISGEDELDFDKIYNF